MIYFLVPILYVVSSTIYYRIQNNTQNFINPNDVLISTLGYYSATLLKQYCKIQISNFQTSEYKIMGNYTPPKFTGTQCNNLTINSTEKSVALYANGTTLYMQLKGNCSQNGIFNIDDTGIMHLICLNKNISLQTTIQNFYVPQQFLRVSANYSYDFQKNNLVYVLNKGNWNFKSESGSIWISSTDILTENQPYNFLVFNITPNNIYDISGNDLFSTTFTEIKYNERCGYVSNKGFLGPFIGIFDKYWPIFQVLDQSGYQILKIQYSKKDCYNIGIINGKQKQCSLWVCPPQLFQYDGKCVSICPQGYFHFIRNTKNRCVINCQQGAYINNITKICRCGSLNPIKCPQKSTSYNLGCNCSKTSMFYDGISDCISTCAPGFLAYDGVCLSCPLKCVLCQINNSTVKISFLICRQCTTGFTLDSDGICISSCNNLKGQSNMTSNNKCQPCKDPNCINCSVNFLLCTKCNLFYALFNGSCNLTCPKNTFYNSYGKNICVNSSDSSCLFLQKYFYQDLVYLQCLTCPLGKYIYKDKCVDNCTAIDSSLINQQNDKVCVCKNNYTTINGVCTLSKYCPLKMYKNQTINACLSCPFGCLTCQPSSGYCTSCAQQYIFFPYNPIYNSTCIYNSPFISCQNGFYQDLQFRCIPMVSNTLITMATNLCYDSIQGCLTCQITSQTICLACNSNTFLHYNQCLQTCPNGYFAYRQVCILNNLNDKNCNNHSVIMFKNWAQINQTIVNQSWPYSFYISSISINNPIANAININDQSYKTTSIIEGKYFCKICNPGFASNYQGICQNCISPCLTCIYLNIYWCTSCINGYQLANNHSCILIQLYGICLSGQYRNSLSNCINTCPYFYNQYSNNNINCTESCPVGTIPILKQNKMLSCIVSNVSNTMNLEISFSTYLLQNNEYIVYIVPSSPFKNPNNIQPILKANHNNTRLLLNSLNNSYLQYIQLSIQSTINDVITLDFSNSLIYTETKSGSYLTNSLYGFKNGSTRTDILKKDLMLVGAIISILYIILIIIYTGLDLTYKVDNSFILVQTVYYFLMCKGILKLDISQFYYGFIFSHFGFIPNIFQRFIPSKYFQYAPASFRLVNLDANIVRNAGFTFTVLIAFVILNLLIFGIIILLKIKLKKNVSYSQKMIKNFAITFWQMISMNIIFFSVTQLKYGTPNATLNLNYQNICQGLSIFIIMITTLYGIIRYFFNKFGGIYFTKRYLLAIILAASIQNPGIIYLVQIIFIIARIILQSPFKIDQFVQFIIQEILILVCYGVLCFLQNNGAIMIITTIVIGTFFLFLVYDLKTIYIESKNQWQSEKQQSQDIELADTERLQN